MNFEKINALKKIKVILDNSLLTANEFTKPITRHINGKKDFDVLCADIYDAAYGSSVEEGEFKNFVVSGLTSKQVEDLMSRFCGGNKVLILPIHLSWEDKRRIIERVTGRTDLNCFINTENALSFVNAVRDVVDVETLNAIKETLLLRNDEISRLRQIIGIEPLRTSEVCKIMLQTGYVHSLSTAIRKIDYFLEEEVLIKISDEQRDFYVKLKGGE